MATAKPSPHLERQRVPFPVYRPITEERLQEKGKTLLVGWWGGNSC